MAPDDAFSRPSSLKVFVAFSIGMLLGVGFVLPAVRDDVSLAFTNGADPIGNVVMIGVLSILVVSTGLFGLIRLFLLVDR